MTNEKMRVACRLLTASLFVGAGSWGADAQSARTPDQPCRVVPTDFEGWKAVEVTNAWVKLTIVPQLGGRLMQVEFAGHPYLFINPQYKGKYFPPAADPAAKGKWYNYGGDKIWPLPEGNQDERHWPGPIADALDDGEYAPTPFSRGKDCGVGLSGPADPRTGLQYSRQIFLAGDSPVIYFHAVMKNATKHPIEWSMQSVTQYDLSDATNSARYNRNFWAYTPANPQSVYLEGFHVRSGLADDPSFSVQNGLFTLHWLYLQNEVWIDSPGDWIALTDRSSHFAMVERFPVVRVGNYPGKATVIFYKNGPAVEINSEGMPGIRTDVDDAPFYMEAEINSPLVRLAPNETYAMDTHWFPARVGDGFERVNEAAVVSEVLRAEKVGSKIHVSGKFGVFYAGELEAHFVDSAGKPIGKGSIAPAAPEELSRLDTTIDAPPAAARILLELNSVACLGRCLVAEAAISPDKGKP
jgi:hypothetical protein